MPPKQSTQISLNPSVIRLLAAVCALTSACHDRTATAVPSPPESVTAIYKLHPEFLTIYAKAYPNPEGRPAPKITGQGLLEQVGFEFPEGAYVTSHPGYWSITGPIWLHEKFLGFHRTLTGIDAVRMEGTEFNFEEIYGPDWDTPTEDPFRSLDPADEAQP